jgi:eukaryotic-like serine/threonine-protein kinase
MTAPSSIAPTAAVGSLAPDFDLRSTGAKGRSALADYRGRWLVLVFYPRDFSLVCPTELSALSARIEEFHDRGCDVLGISADTLESHQRWIATPAGQGGLGGLSFPLASDADGLACRAYGVFLEPQHMALRGLFVIDPNGVLQYAVVHNLSVGRRTDEVLRVLAALQTGGLCAENWTPGDATLNAPRQIGPGSTISHYRIEVQIGKGSFAAVYRAEDTTLQRTVALKILKMDSPAAIDRALDEARSAASLTHPNICTIYSVDDSEGLPVIAMEYLAGKSLAKLIEEGPLPPQKAADIARQIATGMAVAHEAGVVHGDLKPANVFVTDSGTVKVLDFGLSHRAQRARSPDETTELLGGGSGSVAGTPSYMSPEQAVGERAEQVSDVFSLGATLYEMLTGHRAFGGENVLQVLGKIRAVDADKLAGDVPEAFRPVLAQALVREAARRCVTMREIAAGLAALDPSAAAAD